MNIVDTAKAVGATCAAIGTVTGGVIAADGRYAPISVMYDVAVGSILDLVKRAEDNPGEEWLCVAINEELIKLCSRDPNHYLCRAEIQENLRRDAGCQ